MTMTCMIAWKASMIQRLPGHHVWSLYDNQDIIKTWDFCMMSNPGILISIVTGDTDIP